MTKVEQGTASDSDIALLNILNLMQQGYQERNDRDQEAQKRHDELLARIQEIYKIISPEEGDRTGVVTWSQLRNDWKMLWAVVTAIPTILGIISVIISINI